MFQKRSAEWQKCVKMQSRKCRVNRDRFLWGCRSALKPFVAPEVLARIKKSAMAAKSTQKVEQKKESAIPKKPRVSVPATTTSTASSLIPFRRMTSNSLKAAFSAEEPLKEERRFRRLHKSGSSPDRSRSGSLKGEDEERRHWRQLSEGEESGSCLKRRRVMDHSDNEEDQKLNEIGQIENESNQVFDHHMEVDKNGFSDTSNKPESLECDQSEILKSEITMDTTQEDISSKLDEFKLAPDPDDSSEKTDSDESLERLPTLGEPVTSSIPPLGDPDMSLVSYQDDGLLCDAEEKAKKLSLQVLREGVILKNYQRWGVNWLMDAFENKAGAILADEMGM